MKSFKHLLLAKAVAAAVIGTAGVAAPAISHASPDDGVVCRAGYSAQFAGGDMKCSKHVIRHVSLECINPRFPNKLVRVPGVPGDTTNGRDICLAPGRVLASNSPLTGLTVNQDFAFVAINPSKVAATRIATERGEETALGLPADGVDSASTGTLVINGGVGAEDNVTVDVSLFTFPVPALTLVKLPTQIDVPIIDLLANQVRLP
ncbi:MAG: hypothetical protein ACJ8G7_23505 [Rhizobacter sp.]